MINLDESIKFMVNGETMQSLKPNNSVKLVGGGKVQVSHDSECNRKCERARGDLDARIEVKTSIWLLVTFLSRTLLSGAKRRPLRSCAVSLKAIASQMES